MRHHQIQTISPSFAALVPPKVNRPKGERGQSCPVGSEILLPVAGAMLREVATTESWPGPSLCTREALMLYILSARRFDRQVVCPSQACHSETVRTSAWESVASSLKKGADCHGPSGASQ